MTTKPSPPGEGAGEDAWVDYLQQQVFDHPKQSLPLAQETVKRFPRSIDARLYLTQAALHARKPEVAHKELKRIRRKVFEEPVFGLLEALALALEGKPWRGRVLLDKTGLSLHDFDFIRALPIRSRDCLRDLTPAIEDLIDPPRPRPTTSARHPTTRPSSARRASAARDRKPATKGHERSAPVPPDSGKPPDATSEPTAELFRLPSVVPRLHMRVELPAQALAAFDQPATRPDGHEVGLFRLRAQCAELTLFEGFDELLCLPTLRGVEKYWYQVETARKVLKHFKGRVLLADEVGLGKTVEAGLVLKEYVLRGMVERVLILTPAALVGQWHEEMQAKLGLEFTTTRDPELRRDPDAFWSSPRIIASIATARRKEHRTRLVAGTPWDLVIVDEAHHLKNRGSQNYMLVDQLQKRFLLLLSATPVQNSLVELYNLLTLLKPGIFETERDFRAAYMTRGQPRTPHNRHQLRSLMRDVMIRNTRALVDVRLPVRHALTLRPTPGAGLPWTTATRPDASSLLPVRTAGRRRGAASPAMKRCTWSRRPGYRHATAAARATVACAILVRAPAARPENRRAEAGLLDLLIDGCRCARGHRRSAGRGRARPSTTCVRPPDPRLSQLGRIVGGVVLGFLPGNKPTRSDPSRTMRGTWW